MEEKKFHIQNKKFFLTYPQVNDCPDLKSFETTFVNEFPGISSYRICEEKHEDGGKHYHVFVVFENTIRSKNKRYFDLNGHHPNITIPRNKNAVLQYIKKEGNYVEHNLESFIDKKRKLLQLIDEGKAEEAIKCYRNDRPYDFYKHRDAIIQNIKNDIPLEPIPGYNLDSFNHLATRIEWDENKTLIITGPAGIGKSQLARALAKGNYILVHELENIRQLQNKETTLIFDDFRFLKYDRDTILKILETRDPITLPARYVHMTIPRKTKRIITDNATNLFELFGFDDGALHERIQHEDIQGKLFDEFYE